jgi:diacylglycerol kinase (ATP)
MSRPFQFTGRVRSFKYAIQGIRHMLRSQHNAWIHLVATLVTVVVGFTLNLAAGEWCWIVLAISAVWASEAMNTAFEFLCDATIEDFHPVIGHAKDVAAGAVLISAIGSVMVGCIIYLPKILVMIQN